MTFSPKFTITNRMTQVIPFHFGEAAKAICNRTATEALTSSLRQNGNPNRSAPLQILSTRTVMATQKSGNFPFQLRLWIRHRTRPESEDIMSEPSKPLQQTAEAERRFGYLSKEAG